MSQSGPSRRALLGLSAGLPLLGVAARARAFPAADPVAFPNGVTILSSGPAYGYIAGWAKLLAPHFLDGLPPGVTTRFSAMGGPDGVTVCNAFGARLDPDGSTIMFAPGAALLAWLEGDSRVKYEPGRWVATLLGVTPGVLAGRVALTAADRWGPPLRLGVANPIGPELAALLALDLLDMPVQPVFGMEDDGSLIERLRQGRIDLAFLNGPKLHDTLARAAAAGAQPLFSTGAEGCERPETRDPALPAVPSFLEFAAARSVTIADDGRFAAYEAAAAAAAVCFAAVVSELVRPATLAEWRRGADLITDSLSVAAVAVPQGVQLLAGGCAGALLVRASRSAVAINSLRESLRYRYGWRAT